MYYINAIHGNHFLYKQEEDTEEMASGHVQSDNNLGIDVNAGLVHHVTHPDFPNAPNLPGYMKVSEYSI